MAQQQLASRRHADHGIVHGPRDGAVVQEKGVGDAPQAVEGFVVVDADRLVGHVAAGGDDGKPEPAQEEMVQGE